MAWLKIYFQFKALVINELTWNGNNSSRIAEGDIHPPTSENPNVAKSTYIEKEPSSYPEIVAKTPYRA